MSKINIFETWLFEDYCKTQHLIKIDFILNNYSKTTYDFEVMQSHTESHNLRRDEFKKMGLPLGFDNDKLWEVYSKKHNLESQIDLKLNYKLHL